MLPTQHLYHRRQPFHYLREKSGLGSFLPGVTVTLSGIGAPQVLPSDSEGQFRFFSLAPGKYELRAELEGFSPMEYPNVNVSVGGNTEVEMTLNPAAGPP